MNSRDHDSMGLLYLIEADVADGAEDYALIVFIGFRVENWHVVVSVRGVGIFFGAVEGAFTFKAVNVSNF